jgi:hypothetical protein
MRSTRFIYALGAMALGWGAGASAQPAPADPRAPIQCFLRAEGTGLAGMYARQLCVGAATLAPAVCFEQAAHQIGLSDLQAVQLCRMATSTAPAQCAAQLDTTLLANDQLVSYCAAFAGLLAAPSGTGSPACLQHALRQGLSTVQATTLCRGSDSAAPVACYQWGKSNALVTDRDLIDLCAPIAVWAPAPTFR